jgi:hypothetical protein
VDLAIQQDEDSSCDGNDRQDYAEAANPEQLHQTPGDQKDGQQEHADVSSNVHGGNPFKRK